MSGRPIKANLSKFPFKIKAASAQTPAEMIKILKNNDIYINTSTNESFGLCLAEALAMGMPAIALDSVGNRDCMDGKNGIFVKNKKDFQKGLAKLGDYKFRIKLSKQAKESMKQYTLNNTIGQLKKILDI